MAFVNRLIFDLLSANRGITTIKMMAAFPVKMVVYSVKILFNVPNVPNIIFQIKENARPNVEMAILYGNLSNVMIIIQIVETVVSNVQLKMDGYVKELRFRFAGEWLDLHVVMEGSTYRNSAMTEAESMEMDVQHFV